MVLFSGETAGQLDPRIVLLVANGVGKNSTANTILGQTEFDTLQRTAVCVRRQGTIAGNQVTVVDTPGWPAEVTLVESLKQTHREIQFSVSLCLPGPHCFLLTIQANLTFTDTQRNAVQQHLELLRECVWSHTIVLFTCRHHLSKTTISSTSSIQDNPSSRSLRNVGTDIMLLAIRTMMAVKSWNC